jgi:hypothetical protein
LWDRWNCHSRRVLRNALHYKSLHHQCQTSACSW